MYLISSVVAPVFLRASMNCETNLELRKYSVDINLYKRKKLKFIV